MNSLSEEISAYRLELTVDQSNLANPKGLGLKVRGLGHRYAGKLDCQELSFRQELRSHVCARACAYRPRSG
jgi:hypothetical protein